MRSFKNTSFAFNLCKLMTDRPQYPSDLISFISLHRALYNAHTDHGWQDGYTWTDQKIKLNIQWGQPVNEHVPKLFSVTIGIRRFPRTKNVFANTNTRNMEFGSQKEGR